MRPCAYALASSECKTYSEIFWFGFGGVPIAACIGPAAFAFAGGAAAAAFAGGAAAFAGAAAAELDDADDDAAAAGGCGGAVFAFALGGLLALSLSDESTIIGSET